MKRALKLLALILIGTASALNFASCGGGSDASGDEKTGGNNNEQGNEWQQPAYYIDEELGGQVFVDPNQQWGNNNIFTVTGYYEDSYKNAQQFMTTKVDELKKAIVGQTSISLYREIDDALKKMNQGDNIRNNVIGNYTALATVFADINNNRSNFANDSKKYNDYKCSYYKLAHHAYNQALHSDNNYYYNDTAIFPANSDMRGDTNSFFVQQLAYSTYNYDTLTVDEAKRCMNNTLDNIANNNGVDGTILKKFVELALYNESLYGLNDLATGFDLNVIRAGKRQANTFDSYIRNANTQNYTFDDRTM